MSRVDFRQQTCVRNSNPASFDRIKNGSSVFLGIKPELVTDCRLVVDRPSSFRQNRGLLGLLWRVRPWPFFPTSLLLLATALSLRADLFSLSFQLVFLRLEHCRWLSLLTFCLFHINFSLFLCIITGSILFCRSESAQSLFLSLSDKLCCHNCSVCLSSFVHNPCSVNFLHFHSALLLSQVPLSRLVQRMIVDQVHHKDAWLLAAWAKIVWCQKKWPLQAVQASWGSAAGR